MTPSKPRSPRKKKEATVLPLPGVPAETADQDERPTVVGTRVCFAGSPPSPEGEVTAIDPDGAYVHFEGDEKSHHCPLSWLRRLP